MAKCENETCRIFLENQFLQKGFGSFYMNEEIYEQQCVVCKTDLKGEQVTNLLFSDCCFEIKGVINKGEKIVMPWKSTGQGKYLTFDDEGP